MKSMRPAASSSHDNKTVTESTTVPLPLQTKSAAHIRTRLSAMLVMVHTRSQVYTWPS